MKDAKNHRENAKTHFNELHDIVTDQMQGLPCPPLQKPVSEVSKVIDLPKPDQSFVKNSHIFNCLENRRSRRKYTEESLTQEKLSLLLWFTNGVQRIFKRGDDYSVALRTVPSAGARHPLETYLIINRVAGIESGVYRYLGVEHQLVKEEQIICTEDMITEATMGQSFVAQAPVVFLWVAIPYRTEWRYNGEAAKLILLDAGHICQNLYIVAEALGLGTCGIAAYDQEKIDQALQLDGDDEFVVYLAPVGKL
ncbi:MAG: SagB/ThcOx family dehydrogenase [Candidatus Cloacimonetes bacterium]|nr:SagB/ThcOx family dehydrogenase [Candidatus Cloacimonadota bacterium]